MEELTGKQYRIKGKLILNGVAYDYEEYNDPNRPHNLRTVVFYRPDKDAVMVEYNTEKDALQKVAEQVLKSA